MVAFVDKIADVADLLDGLSRSCFTRDHWRWDIRVSDHGCDSGYEDTGNSHESSGDDSGFSGGSDVCMTTVVHTATSTRPMRLASFLVETDDTLLEAGETPFWLALSHVVLIPRSAV